MGLPGRPGRLLAELNYYGTIQILEAARPWLARGSRPAAVAISSNSTTAMPGLRVELTQLLLDGDPTEAIAYADKVGSPDTYPASKLAVAHWVRRHAPKAEWAGAGITLNAVAPGKTETAMLAEGRADAQYGPLIDAFPVPVGRSAQPDELAALIAFLLGPDARFLCGSVVFCDGGTDAQLRPNDFPSPDAEEMKRDGQRDRALDHRRPDRARDDPAPRAPQRPVRADPRRAPRRRSTRSPRGASCAS